MVDITLRPITLDDWTSVHEWARSDEGSRYQEWGPNTADETRRFAEEAVAAWQVDPPDRMAWVAEDGTSTVVGLGELLIRDRAAGRAEIGYGVHLDHWGRGIATSIASQLLRLAFSPPLDLHRIAATCDPRNVASARVLQHVGMVHEGRLREDKRLRDGWRDSDVYAVLAHEWRHRQRVERPAST